MTKTNEFPFGNKDIKIVMLGVVDGNGHPYSWSAIFNGNGVVIKNAFYSLKAIGSLR